MTTNLAGSLDTFGLDEVLSMLAMGGRNARMEVSSPSGDGEIQLVAGHVSAASADRGRATLLRQLVGAAGVSATDLACALEGDDPVRALVDTGTVERGFAHSVAVEQIVDALGEMLTWSEGEFAVHVGSEHPGDIGIRLPMDEAIDRGRGRADEWVRVRTALPADHEVLALVPSVGDGLSLGREDWAVLVRVDGRRTLGEVVAAAGCAPLVASDRIVDLMGRGLVRVRTEDAGRPDEVAQLLDALDRPRPGESAPSLDAGRGLDLPESEVLPHAEPVHEVPGVAWDAGEPVGLDAGAAPAIVEADEVPGTAESDGVGSAEDVAPEPASAVAVLDEPVGMLSDVEEPVGMFSDVEEPVAVEPFRDGADDVSLAADLAEPWGLAVPALATAAVESDQAVADPVVGVVVQQDAEPVGYASLAPDPAVESVEEFRFPIEVEPQGAALTEGWDLSADEPGASREPVAGAVEWSPWAQALGLGAPAPEGELVGDPLAGPGIAEMIAGAHAVEDTEVVPVPLAPAVDPAAQDAEALVFEPVTGAVAFEPAPESVVLEPGTDGFERATGAVLPEPRVSAEAANDAPAGAMDAEGDHQPADEPVAQPAPDPLSGGLLAQLMSGVRGL